MRLILQRVRSASVRVEGETVGAIGRGLLVLAAVEQGDTAVQAEEAAHKLAGLRLFQDADGKMNLDAAAAGAAYLVVSQFTLAGSLDRGRRPSFDRAAPPAEAARLLELLVARLRRGGFTVATGRFGERMEVELVNDGPVTFVLDVRPAGGAALTPAAGRPPGPA
ncbi:MAG TPA: D-aminoacyl-tRNA deacylase [Thermoanaerobaculia bacterium]|nr:D-aminoacyl-tRNA deacylase [Thermoanaerobaculia bacterium]